MATTTDFPLPVGQELTTSTMYRFSNKDFLKKRHESIAIVLNETPSLLCSGIVSAHH